MLRNHPLNWTLPALALIAWLLAPAAGAGPLMQTDVFVSGQEGYHTFRIPAIVQAADGSLLAFAEGRKNSGSDFGDIDLVLKRSLDGGATWGPLQVIHNNATQEAGNPAPVVDRDTGNVLIPFVNDRRAPVLKISSDHGATWGPLIELGTSARDPSWDGYAFGPVHAIQLQRGPHAGRLIIPGNHSFIDRPLNPDGREAHLIYSDDGGANWQVGAILRNPDGEVNPNESTVVELTDGRVYINTRNQGSPIRRRLIGFSTDGGESFTNLAQVEDQLIDPQVQGAVVRYAATDQGDDHNRVLFSNPATIDTRRRMTIKSSFDETETWNAGKLVYRGRSAYSDLVRLGPDQGGLLFEKGITANYQRITFVQFDTEWLDSPDYLYMDFRGQAAEDLRGHGLHGRVQGAPEFVPGDPRYGGGTAIRFDGVDDRVRIEDELDSIVDFEGQDSFTLEVVFRTSNHTDGGANGSGPLISKDVGPGSPSYWLRVEDGRARFLIDDGNIVADVVSTADVADGQWHHLAAVRDRNAQRLLLYLDYRLIGTTLDFTQGDFANANDLLIGVFNQSAPGRKRFVGDIDLVRVSGGALKPAEFVLILGDLNADGFVGAGDLDILLDSWNQQLPGHVADLNGDGFIGAGDLDILLNNWNQGPPPSAQALPEPATLSVIGLGAVGLGLGRPAAERRG